VTDRWTEAQLRGELFWVLSLTWAGGTFYISSSRLNIANGTEIITTTSDLVDVPSVEEAVEVWSVEAPRLSVPLSFLLPVNVPELIAEGHALDGAVGELSQWADGTEWSARRVVVRGQLVDPEYGAEWEPIICSIEEMVADTQTTLPLETIIIQDWLAIALGSSSSRALSSDVIPMVWGTPGNGTAPGSPAPLVGSSGTYVNVAIACHYCAATSVSLVDASGTQESFPLKYEDVRYQFGSRRGFPVVAYVTVDTFSSSLNLDDALGVIWDNGAALVDESAQAVRGLGDFLAHILRRSALRVDWGRVEGARAALNQYATDGYIDEPVALGEYITGVLADAFPFAMAGGPEGVYPYLWPVYPQASAAIAALDTEADPELQRLSRISYEGSDEIATHIEVSYAWDPLLSAYTKTQRVAGEVTIADDKRTTIKQLIGPFARYGTRRKVLETTVIHDDASAIKVGIAQAARYGQPSRLVQYEAPQRYGWLRRGDLVTLTDAEIAASSQVCLVEGIAWNPDGALALSLRYIEAGA